MRRHIDRPARHRADRLAAHHLVDGSTELGPFRRVHLTAFAAESRPVEQHGVVEVGDAAFTNTLGRTHCNLGREASRSGRYGGDHNGVQPVRHPRSRQHNDGTDFVVRNFGPPDLAVGHRAIDVYAPRRAPRHRLERNRRRRRAAGPRPATRWAIQRGQRRVGMAAR